MPSPANLIGLLWLAWLVSWFLAAGWSAPTRSRAPRVDQLRHTTPVWIGAILLFARPRWFGALLDPLYPETVVLAWGMVFMVIFGLGWAWWARIHLGQLWSARITIKEGHTVVRSGPYRLTRHPIYSGMLLALLATAVQRDCWAAFAGWVVLVVGFVIKYRQEEALLLATLGDGYLDYRRDVPALVPRLSRRS